MTTNERNENEKKMCKQHKQTLNTEAHERYIYAQDKRCIKGQTAGLIVYVPKAKRISFYIQLQQNMHSLSRHYLRAIFFLNTSKQVRKLAQTITYTTIH